MSQTDPVIVAGAGPGGLTAALALASAGVKVLVCERETELAIDLRAGSYHPPTLEMLSRYGVTDRMHETGVVVPHWQIRDREEGVLVEFDLGLLKDETAFPYRLHLEQHKLTPMLLDACRAFPHFDIAFGTSVTGLTQDADGVTVQTAGGEGPAEHRAAFVIGADGHHSAVRNALEIEFEGFTWPEAFLVVSTPHDFDADGFTGAAYIADPEEWVVMFHLPEMWRVGFPVNPETPAPILTEASAVEARLQRVAAHGTPYEIIHRNIYRVHQRVAAAYVQGRVGLVGDAAHVNNPLGGMGLNGSVHDAVCLAEKIAAILNGEAGMDAMAQYERQRRPVQIEYVQKLSVRNKRMVEERDPAIRQRHRDELRALADDSVRAKAYLMDSSMISMVREAAAIA
jgi:3-(3-hydroxy-phenyl)propionate hydroxylase